MDNRPTIAEVQEWVLKIYNTCEQTITSEERKGRCVVIHDAPSFFSLTIKIGSFF